MSFTLDTWKESIKKNLDGWRVRMRETGVESIYSFVSASALLPLIQAVSGGELVAIAELGRLTSSLGTSLLASKLQNWKNESDAAKKIESEIESNLDLRKELDEVLKKLKALPLAIEAVKGDDREWFKQTLHGELDRMGNLDNFRNVIIQGPDTVTPSALRDAYLNRLFEKCRQLSLSGVDPQAATGHKGAQQLSLDAVYTALLTLTSEEHEHLLQERAPQREIRRQSALEQLNRHPKLVLLGDPGSGKSTFVNFVALCMAGALLDKEKINLDLLVSPLPNEDVEGNTPQAWDHQALIPVRIILRDFAARGLPHVGEKATAVHLWDFIASELESATLKDYCKPLQDELLNK
ncbi:MAG: hypothetical protein GY941_28295, partial [Planctomycetes bacterium]|nr:hypothetical protein [Planctomycetota bacterium]